MSLAEQPTEQPTAENCEVFRFIPRGPRMGPEKSTWWHYYKPITLLLIGGIVLLVGILHTTFYFTKYVDVPYALGPILLSVGTIFLVTGLVWLPVITESIRRKGIQSIMTASD